jgi:hypothetical protein
VGNKKNDLDKEVRNKRNQNKGPNELPKKQQWRPKPSTSATLTVVTGAPREEEQEKDQPPPQKSQEYQDKNTLRVGVEPVTETTGEMHFPTGTNDRSTRDSPM